MYLTARVATVQSSPPSPQALNWDWTSVPTNLQTLSVPRVIHILFKYIYGEKIKDVIYTDFYTTYSHLTFQFYITIFKIKYIVKLVM